MSTLNLLLRIDAFKRLMILKDNEFFWKKIMTPVAQGLNHSIKFLIMGRISYFGVIQFLTKVSYWVTLLT